MKQSIKRMKEFVKKNLKWIILFVCLIVFLTIVEDVLDKEIMEGDIMGYNFISTYFISEQVTPIAKLITNFGGATYLILITIILLLVIKNKKIGLAIFLNLALSAVLNFLLKNILQMPRPTEYRLIHENRLQLSVRTLNG